MPLFQLLHLGRLRQHPGGCNPQVPQSMARHRPNLCHHGIEKIAAPPRPRARAGGKAPQLQWCADSCASGSLSVEHLLKPSHPVAGSQDSKMMNSSTTLLNGPGSCAASCSDWWLSDSMALSSTKAALSKMRGAGGASSSSLCLASSAFRGRFGPCSAAVFSVVLFRFVPVYRLQVKQTSRST